MILVAGGSGLLGRTLIPLLLDRGEQVHIVTRGTRQADHLALPGVETIVGDIRDRAVVDRAVAGARTVISAIHGFGGEGALGARAIDRDANGALIDAATAAGNVLIAESSLRPDSPRVLKLSTSGLPEAVAVLRKSCGHQSIASVRY